MALGRGTKKDDGSTSLSAKAKAKAKGAPRGGKPAKPVKKAGPSRKERFGQLKLAFTMTQQRDPKMLPFVLGGFLLTVLVFVLFGFLVFGGIPFTIIGVLFGLVVAASIFGRRVQKTAYAQVEGQPGAAAAVLQNMRGDWRVTPAVGFTKEQDLVHRVIGRPGVVLVAEGAPNRTRNLVGAEKRRLARVVGDTPVYEVFVGEHTTDGGREVALKELEKHFAKLPRNIKPAQVNVLDGRLKALGATPLPVPKGPVPTRVPRGGRGR